MASYVQDMKAVLEGLMVCFNTTGGRSVQQKFASMNFDEEVIEKAADIRGEGKISYTIEERFFLSDDAGRDGNNDTQKP